MAKAKALKKERTETKDVEVKKKKTHQNIANLYSITGSDADFAKHGSKRVENKKKPREFKDNLGTFRETIQKPPKGTETIYG